MSTLSLALIPRDGLFCKDGRGWSTSTSGRGHALDWPYPSTVLGALRTAYGRRIEQLENRRLDEHGWHQIAEQLRLRRSLALRRAWVSSQSWVRMWPVPADVRVVDRTGADSIEYLDPRPPEVPTLGRDGDHTHPRERLWTAVGSTRAKPKPRPRWWAEPGFVAWLSAPASGPLPLGFDLTRRHQTHVGIQSETRTAAEGVLFSHDVVETLEPDAEWAIACELELPGLELPRLITLGSDRRLAAVEDLDRAVFDMPPQLEQAFVDGRPLGLRLIAVTPIEFERGWLPDGLRENDGYRGRIGSLDCEVELQAAMIDRSLAISGWDMLKGRPKPTSRMLPPGSVLAFRRVDREPFTLDQAKALWLAAIGRRTNEGFGRVVPGVWHPDTGSNES